MEISFGNLNVTDFEKRLGIQFSEEDKQWIRESRQEDVSIRLAPGKLHIFDLPFSVHCADNETATKLLFILRKFDTNKFPLLSIGVQN